MKTKPSPAVHLLGAILRLGLCLIAGLSANAADPPPPEIVSDPSLGPPAASLTLTLFEDYL